MTDEEIIQTIDSMDEQTKAKFIEEFVAAVSAQLADMITRDALKRAIKELR
jgi:hypothetical protein